ncbi:MAG: alpha/beta hydrolase-fold protein [Gammaproteobacteria bacterium]
MRNRWMGLALACALAANFALASGADVDIASEPESPKLRALAAALRANEDHALDTFWRQVKAGNTPLVEPVPGHPDDALYTFLWKADAAQVALNVQFNGWFPMRATRGFDNFTRLGESNVWYTSYVLPRTMQIRYELIAPKGWHAAADRATYFTMDDREYETFHDPLNPQLTEWNDSTTSHAQGPDATTSPYLKKRADVAAGGVEMLDVESRILGNRRTLRVYLPPGYRDSDRDYGLLLAYDGNQYTQAVPTPVILDNMIAAKAIPPVITVFMESPDRDVEFPPNDDFQRFVGNELMPQLRKRYRIDRDPSHNGVLGSSYGGLAALYTGLVHPELFGNVISQSGSFGWSPPQPPAAFASAPAAAAAPPPFRGTTAESGWLIKRVAETPRKNLRLYLDAGTWEGGGMLSSNRLMRSVLIGKGYDVVYRESPGTHSSYYWMLRLPEALKAGLAPRR